MRYYYALFDDIQIGYFLYPKTKNKRGIDMKKRTDSIINIIRDTIYKFEEATTIDIIAKNLHVPAKQAKRYVQKYKSTRYITYDTDYINFRVLKDNRMNKNINAELATWKQKQTVDLYYSGLEIINNRAIRATDRVKQIEINAKLLKSIDSVDAWEHIQRLEEARELGE